MLLIQIDIAVLPQHIIYFQYKQQKCSISTSVFSHPFHVVQNIVQKKIVYAYRAVSYTKCKYLHERNNQWFFVRIRWQLKYLNSIHPFTHIIIVRSHLCVTHSSNKNSHWLLSFHSFVELFIINMRLLIARIISIYCISKHPSYSYQYIVIWE